MEFKIEISTIESRILSVYWNTNYPAPESLPEIQGFYVYLDKW